MIHVSIGTANSLDLKKIKTDVNPTTAYFMTPGKCFFNCAYCSQARDSSKSNKLSRVVWPAINEDKAFKNLSKAYKQKKVKRACIQVINNEKSFDHTIRYVKKIRKYSKIPISVSIRTKNIEFLDKLFEAGVDRISLPLDIVDKKLYPEYRNGSFEETLDLIENASKKYPGKISTHIIVGLDETEKQTVQLLKKFHDLNVIIGLFAFTPIKGTSFEDREPPSLSKYRRIQIAHYLITHDIKNDFEYDSDGKIIRFDISRKKLKGTVFQTTGCPDCNRPYYNESPGGIMYNYPFPLSEKQFESELKEIRKI
jgi:biotin synthase